MKRIQLTPAEVAFCVAVAMQRNATKRDSSLFSPNQSRFASHLVGVIGELAFQKAYGGKVNQEIIPNGDGHKPDIVLPDGRKVEVKTSTFTGKNVEIKFRKTELDFEWCSLAQIVGWPDMVNVFPIWPKSEMKLTTKDYGNGPRYVFSPRCN
jgi:hypothetical protein